MVDDPYFQRGSSLAREGPGCLKIGCLGGLAAFGLLMFVMIVFGNGIGQPSTFHREIDAVQLFETESDLTLFVEVDRVRNFPGFIARPPHDRAVRHCRIDVTPKGEVTTRDLVSTGYVTFNTNIALIMRTDEAVYLVGHREFHRITDDRIERLSDAETAAILGPLGNPQDKNRRSLDDFSAIDAISSTHGWARLNGSSYMFSIDCPIKARRHPIRVIWEETAGSQAIVAESTDPARPWRRTLISESTRRWTSHNADGSP